MGKKNLLLPRLALSLVLLGFLISKLDFDAMGDVLGEFSAAIYLAGFSTLMLSQFLYAFLLKSLIGKDGGGTGIGKIFRALAVGSFLGLFIPGSTGPEIMLAYNLSKNSRRKEHPLSAIIFSRVVVLFASITVACVISLSSSKDLAGFSRVFIPMIAVFLIFAFLTANRRCFAVSSKILSFLEKTRWTRIIYRMYFVMAEYGREKALMLKSLGLGLAVASTRVLVDFLVSKSLGLDIPVQYFFVFVPLISIAAVIPVSLAGIGVREGSYIGLFSAAGVKPAEAFSISILSFSAGIIFSLAGFLIYLAKGTTLTGPEKKWDKTTR